MTDSLDIAFLRKFVEMDKKRFDERQLEEARFNGFETTEEYQAHVRHLRSPLSRIRRLFGWKPEKREPLDRPPVWRRNSVRTPFVK